MHEARAILENHLRRVGLTSPADAAQLMQVTMLRQMVDTLEAVMADEEVPAATRLRVIRGQVYGSMPEHSEAESVGCIVPLTVGGGSILLYLDQVHMARDLGGRL